MSRSISQIISSLVDKTQSLGGGLVDSKGLLIHSSGYHGKKDKDEFAVYLLAMSPKNINSYLADELKEFIILGKDFKIYCYWLDGAQYLVYLLAKSDIRGKTLRTYLHEAATNIEQRLNPSSVTAVSQRLEQPRHMSSDRWPAADFENILK